MRLDEMLDKLAELIIEQANLCDGGLSEESKTLQTIIDQYRVAIAKHYNYNRDCMMWIKGNLDARCQALAYS